MFVSLSNVQICFHGNNKTVKPTSFGQKRKQPWQSFFLLAYFCLTVKINTFTVAVKLWFVLGFVFRFKAGLHDKKNVLRNVIK